MLAAFLATILFSLSAITGRRLSHYISGTQANVVRLLIAATVLGTFSHLFGFGLTGVAFPVLFLSGCVGFGIGDLSMFQAYPRIGARRTIVLIQCLAAPFGGLIEWLWLHHMPTSAQAFFGVVILTGVAIALIPAKKDAQPTHGLVAGTLFGILAGFCQGSSAVISRKAYEISTAGGSPFPLRDRRYQRRVSTHPRRYSRVRALLRLFGNDTKIQCTAAKTIGAEDCVGWPPTPWPAQPSV